MMFLQLHILCNFPNKNPNKTNIACYLTELTPNVSLLIEIIPSWLQVIFSPVLDHSPTNCRRNFTFTVGASLNKSPRHSPCLKPSLCGKRLIPLRKILPTFQKSPVMSTQPQSASDAQSMSSSIVLTRLSSNLH